jgi:SnoaL-like domain
MSEVEEPDYDSLLRGNLQRVFNERDATKRAAALAELYVADPVMYEPTATVTGQAAISEVAGKLLEQFDPTFGFRPEGAAVGHHGLGSLRWQAGPAGGPVVVTGTDVAEIVGGRIVRLWVLLNPPNP